MRIGVLPSPQNTTWPAMRALARTADELGCYSLWCSDHLYAPPPWPSGGTLDSLSVLAAWAELTTSAVIGGMVHPVAIRDPALLVKALTTIDHISGGRVCAGVGAGWYEAEHLAYGSAFGTPGERVARLDEAVGIIRMLLSGARADGSDHYRYVDVRNVPAPAGRMPILVGGQGSRTLGIVAEHADIWNVYGRLETVAERDAYLRRECERIGRDEALIERTYHVGPMIIRDTTAEALKVARAICADNGFTEEPLSPALATASGAGPGAIGSIEEISEYLRPIVGLGFRHMYFDLMSPYDEESLHRLLAELRPALEAA